MFRPHIKRKRVLVALALANLILVYISYISYEFFPASNYDLKIKAARIMKETLSNISSEGKNILIKEGGDILIIAVGPMLQRVVEACSGIDATILYCTSVKPFDHLSVQENLKKKTIFHLIKLSIFKKFYKR